MSNQQQNPFGGGNPNPYPGVNPFGGSPSAGNPFVPRSNTGPRFGSQNGQNQTSANQPQGPDNQSRAPGSSSGFLPSFAPANRFMSPPQHSAGIEQSFSNNGSVPTPQPAAQYGKKQLIRQNQGPQPTVQTFAPSANSPNIPFRMNPSSQAPTYEDLRQSRDTLPVPFPQARQAPQTSGNKYSGQKQYPGQHQPQQQRRAMDSPSKSQAPQNGRKPKQVPYHQPQPSGPGYPQSSGVNRGGQSHHSQDTRLLQEQQGSSGGGIGKKGKGPRRSQAAPDAQGGGYGGGSQVNRGASDRQSRSKQGGGHQKLEWRPVNREQSSQVPQNVRYA